MESKKNAADVSVKSRNRIEMGLRWSIVFAGIGVIISSKFSWFGFLISRPDESVGFVALGPIVPPVSIWEISTAWGLLVSGFAVAVLLLAANGNIRTAGQDSVRRCGLLVGLAFGQLVVIVLLAKFGLPAPFSSHSKVQVSEYGLDAGYGMLRAGRFSLFLTAVELAAAVILLMRAIGQQRRVSLRKRSGQVNHPGRRNANLRP